MTDYKSVDLVSGRRRSLQGIAIALTVLTIGSIIGAIITDFSCREIGLTTFLPYFSGSAFTLVGLLIIIFRPGNRVGWLVSLSGLGMAGSEFLAGYVACHLVKGISLPGVVFVAWFAHRLAHLLLAIPLFIILPFLFPTGRFLTPRWRKLCLLMLAIIGVITFVVAFAPDMRINNGLGLTFDFDSPVRWTGLPNDFYANLFILQTSLIIMASIAGIAAMVARFKRSRGIERQQMKWFAYFLVVPTVQLLLFELPGLYIGVEQIEALSWYGLFDVAYAVVLYLVFVGVPLVIGLTIFRYRLYGIDIIIRRTLIYSVVILSLAAIYFGSVVLMQRLFTSVSGQQSPAAIVISTLIIAALSSPVFRRVRDVIDRRFYRRKYDAGRILAQFATTARDEVDLDQITAELLRVVETTMHPESISVWFRDYNN